MKGLFLQPRNSEEERHNWRLVSDSVALTQGRLGGQEVQGGTAAGEDLTLKSNPSADGEIKLGSHWSIDETNEYATMGPGSPRWVGRTATSADPTTTELPADKDFGLHKNTSSGSVFLAYNDSGTILKVEII